MDIMETLIQDFVFYQFLVLLIIMPIVKHGHVLVSVMELLLILMIKNVLMFVQLHTLLILILENVHLAVQIMLKFHFIKMKPTKHVFPVVLLKVILILPIINVNLLVLILSMQIVRPSSVLQSVHQFQSFMDKVILICV